MPYFDARTPPFVDPADYGRKKKPVFTPPWLPRPAEPPPLEEPRTFAPSYRQSAASVPNYSASAPPPLAEPSMPDWEAPDEARETTRQAIDLKRRKMKHEERGEGDMGPPTAPHDQRGFKKVLHTIGDIFLDQDVMHPNVARQRQDYFEKMATLERQGKSAEDIAEENRKIAAMESQEALRDEQAETQRRQQRKIDQDMNAPPKLRPPVNVPPGGTLVDQETGKVLYQGAPLAAKETPAEATARRTSEADVLGLKGQDRVNYVAGRNVVRPPRSEEKKAPAAAFRLIEQKKNTQMLAAKKAAQKAEVEIANDDSLEGLLVKPEEKERRRQQIWKDYADQMEMIQLAYESEIVAAGGDVAPKPAGAPAPKTPDAPPPPVGKVKLVSPDGSEVVEVPADQAQHFISLGAKRL